MEYKRKKKMKYMGYNSKCSTKMEYKRKKKMKYMGYNSKPVDYGKMEHKGKRGN